MEQSGFAMTLVPFAYAVSVYDAEEDGSDANYCDAPDCPNSCAYIFRGTRMASDPYRVFAGNPASVERTLHYCVTHAQKFAAMEDLILPQ
jgi:hypothetical protein